MRVIFIRVVWPAVVIASLAYLALTQSGLKDNELAGTPITLRSSLPTE